LRLLKPLVNIRRLLHYLGMESRRIIVSGSGFVGGGSGSLLLKLAEPNVPLVAVCGSGRVVTLNGSLHEAITIMIRKISAFIPVFT
jgi:hypothetical protein